MKNVKRLGTALRESIRKSRVEERAVIEGAFLVTHHGILVAKTEGYHHSDVVMSMLSAVENFVADSLALLGAEKGDRQKMPLYKLKCGEYTIIIEKGRLVNLVLLIHGSETKLMLQTMRELLYEIHARFESLLINWDGEWGKTRAIEKKIQFAVQEWNRIAKERP